MFMRSIRFAESDPRVVKRVTVPLKPERKQFKGWKPRLTCFDRMEAWQFKLAATLAVLEHTAGLNSDPAVLGGARTVQQVVDEEANHRLSADWESEDWRTNAVGKFARRVNS